MPKALRSPIFMIVILSVCAAAILWFFLSRLPEEYSQKASLVPAANANTAPVYPELPDQWRGRVDYIDFDARIRTLMEDPAMAGLAVAVVEDGRLSFVHGYGVTDRTTGEKVTPTTVFRWASVSKGVAATLVADLVADGKLNWKTPIASYGTSLRLPDHAEHYLGLDAILSHRLGLPKNAYDGQLEGGKSPMLIRASLAGVNKQCAPGDCHSYQNVAYDTVSEIVRNATHASYAQQVKKRLFGPLGMTSASIGRDGLVGAESWAKPYNGSRQLDVSPNYYHVPAAAGVNSDIIDLAKWMQAQMGQAPRVLTPAELQTLHTPRIGTRRVYGNSEMGRALASPAYGLGWRSFVYDDESLVGHSGAVNGYRASVMFDPARRTGIVMLWNSQSARPFRLQLELFDMYRSRESRNWLQLKKVPQIAAAQDGVANAQSD